MNEKSQVEDIDRSIYDIRDEEKDAYRMEEGLTPEIVEKLSEEKGDPEWMRQFRLKSLEIYNKMPIPDWGPSIEGLDMDHIATYVRPHSKMQASWKDVPEDIKDTFERLGIPQAERESLAGVGAQYDSELVYHNVKDEVAAQGVVYTDMESALKGEYADMVQEYFMKLVTPHDHKFAALHGAVWSGGSFVYVPKNVEVSIPLQSYFRLNAKGAGQFEHTLIIVDEGASLHFIEGCSAPKYNVANLHAGCVELFVKKNAKLRYSTIENWSKNMYNLNTKRAIVDEGGTIEWVSGSFGSHVGCLYPMSILKGKGARMEFTGVTFAGKGQNLDTGAKVVHAAEDTSSYMN
ncbi:MAG: Fe-S cluster assembly protein SufB, partial [Lachnospiraceae bacterium]|nr:Fe-S cluster assembly protein SufB [Lachnospiraceae bacterium]